MPSLFRGWQIKKQEGTKTTILEGPRNFLYREYLRMLVATRPAVFVMENVKGLLSTKIKGHPIFESILTDLQQPQDYMNGLIGPKYRVYSLVAAGDRDSNLLGSLDLKPIDYLVKAEEFGIPQAKGIELFAWNQKDLKNYTKYPRIILANNYSRRSR